jgi:hypothetical protein
MPVYNPEACRASLEGSPFDEDSGVLGSTPNQKSIRFAKKGYQN